MTALSTQFGPGLLSLPLMVLLAINNNNLNWCSLLLHPLTLGGVTGRVTFRDAAEWQVQPEAGFTWVVFCAGFRLSTSQLTADVTSDHQRALMTRGVSRTPLLLMLATWLGGCDAVGPSTISSTNTSTISSASTSTISSAITCSSGSFPDEVGWSLSCSDDTTLSGGARYTSSSPLAVEFGATCTLNMTDSQGDGWNGAEWAAPGFGQSFSLTGGSGQESFVVQFQPPSPPPPSVCSVKPTVCDGSFSGTSLCAPLPFTPVCHHRTSRVGGGGRNLVARMIGAPGGEEWRRV